MCIPNLLTSAAGAVILVIKKREVEKKQKYQDLAADLTKTYPGFKVVVTPIVLGDLGTIGDLKKHLNTGRIMNAQQINKFVQREVLCSAIHIIRRHLMAE